MKGINTFTLKIIALVSMLIDHIGMVFFPNIILFRMLGRIAFPIFAYTLVEGFIHTHNVKKYMIRLGMFAVLSEVPFDLATTGKVVEVGHQNVFFTLFLSVAMLFLFEAVKDAKKQFLIVAMAVFCGRLLRLDYGSTGMLMVILFYYLRDRKWEKLFSVGLLILATAGFVQLFSILALIPIAMYNEERGPNMKVLFYAFYPLHLLVLYIVKMIF